MNITAKPASCVEPGVFSASGAMQGGQGNALLHPPVLDLLHPPINPRIRHDPLKGLRLRGRAIASQDIQGAVGPQVLDTDFLLPPNWLLGHG